MVYARVAHTVHTHVMSIGVGSHGLAISTESLPDQETLLHMTAAGLTQQTSGKGRDHGVQENRTDTDTQRDTHSVATTVTCVGKLFDTEPGSSLVICD